MAEPAIDRAARIGDGFLSTGGIGHDLYLSGLAKAGKAPEDGAIYAGHWGIVSDDPERELAVVGEHLLYQINEYVAWGAFGPPGTVPPFASPAAAVEHGMYELWSVETAVEELTRMLRAQPQVVDVHFWAQFPGEPVAAGSRRLEVLARRVLPAVRARLEED